MEDNPIDELFEDFDIVTREEFMMLYSKVFYKLKYCRMMVHFFSGSIKNGLIDSFIDPADEELRQFAEEYGMVGFCIIMTKGALNQLVADSNPRKKIYEIVDRLYICVDETFNDIVKEATPEQRGAMNILLALIIYIILYYRFRDINDYSKYILPALAEKFLPLIQEDGGLDKLHELIEALPPHDETEAERKRLEAVPEEEVRDMLVSANEEIRQLKMQVIDLEAQLNDTRNEASVGDDGEDSPRFYKRKMQLGLLRIMMRRAGIDIKKNKSAATILISNLLHISNYKSVQKMLSEDTYLRTADHGEACAEVNGILKELAAPFKIMCKASKSVKEGEIPLKDYTEILKFYKNTGE